MSTFKHFNLTITNVANVDVDYYNQNIIIKHILLIIMVILVIHGKDE